MHFPALSYRRLPCDIIGSTEAFVQLAFAFFFFLFILQPAILVPLVRLDAF